MSNKKKIVRAQFMSAVFARDNWTCRVCGYTIKESVEEINAHHITDRNEMPNGGYVLENGITLCLSCHVMAEFEHTCGRAFPGYTSDDLYSLIGSSYQDAYAASLKLLG